MLKNPIKTWGTRQGSTNGLLVATEAAARSAKGRTTRLGHVLGSRCCHPSLLLSLNGTCGQQGHRAATSCCPRRGTNELCSLLPQVAVFTLKQWLSKAVQTGGFWLSCVPQSCGLFTSTPLQMVAHGWNLAFRTSTFRGILPVGKHCWSP